MYRSVGRLTYSRQEVVTDVSVLWKFVVDVKAVAIHDSLRLVQNCNTQRSKLLTGSLSLFYNSDAKWMYTGDRQNNERENIFYIILKKYEDENDDSSCENK